MSDIDPHHVQQAAEQAPGIWSMLATGLAGAMATVGGFIFKDQNVRLKAIESCHIDMIRRFGGMATKQDIKDIHKKIERLSSDNTDRIIDIIKKLPKG